MAVRRALQVASALGAALLTAGVCWGFARRDVSLDGGTTVMLAAGTLACVGAMAVAVLLERAPDGLVLPAGEQLPAPAFGGPLLLVALCDVVGGAYASPPALLAGALLAVPASWWVARQVLELARQQSGQSGQSGQSFDLTSELLDSEPDDSVAGSRQPGQGLDRGTVVAARRLLAFGRRHAVDGDARTEAAVEHTGRDLARILVVGRDGAYGDVLVRGLNRAQRALALAGAGQRDSFARDFASRIKTGVPDWQRMGGTKHR